MWVSVCVCVCIVLMKLNRAHDVTEWKNLLHPSMCACWYLWSFRHFSIAQSCHYGSNASMFRVRTKNEAKQTKKNCFILFQCYGKNWLHSFAHMHRTIEALINGNFLLSIDSCVCAHFVRQNAIPFDMIVAALHTRTQHTREPMHSLGRIHQSIHRKAK